MAKSVLNSPIFSDEAAAFAKLESIVWPNGPTCPKCGATDRIGTLEGVQDKKGRVRLGLKKCYHCRSQFTVRVGTVFEASHVPLHIWFQAVYLLCSSKKGISSNQLHRTLGVTLKTAWFMSHRIREAMRDGFLSPMGGEGAAVEVDEAYIGGKESNKPKHKRHGKRGTHGKEPVLSLVERGGKVRSFHMPDVTAANLREVLTAQIDRATFLNTDESGSYTKVGQEFARHEAVFHAAGEYVRGDATTNTVEGYFSILKRGITGVYQHVSQQHLGRYLAEFDFRYNERVALGANDTERTIRALCGIVGKRLTYRDSSAGARG